MNVRRASVVLLLFFIFFISSCTSDPSEKKPATLEQIVNDFAQLECRAIALREQRFQIANQIRFTQDTLLHRAADKGDTSRLNAKLNTLGIERERTTQQSLALADSIKYTLDSLMSHYLTKKEDKHKFTQMLHNKLENMNCKDSL